MKSTVAIAYAIVLALAAAVRAAPADGIIPPHGSASASIPAAALKVEDWKQEKVEIKAQKKSAKKGAPQSAKPQRAPD
jgi:hypothetical protein